MNKKYQIKNLVLMVKDEASVKYHISQDDYFGTIATIISLIKQKINKNPAKCPPDFKEVLTNLENDLTWLQTNYQITPKIKKKKIMPKGSEKNQCSKNISKSKETIMAKEKVCRRPSRIKK